MIELACPSCGRAGSIPREKINTRLTCKKCHIAFHVNTAGRALVGEPHVEPAKHEPSHHEGLHLPHLPHLPTLEDLDELKEGLLPKVSPRTLGVSAAALVIFGGLYLLLTKPPESLADSARRTAERFASDDLAYLKQVATTETIDDVVRWFDAVHPQLVKSREQWKNPETRIQVMVIGEDRQLRKGESQAFIYPADGSGGAASRVTAIAAAADATTAGTVSSVQPVELKLHWVLDRKGNWKLDGLQTFQAVAGSL